MKEFSVVGIDVSKCSLDAFFKPCDAHMQIENNVQGFKAWYRQLLALTETGTKVLVVMEHTGGYSRMFERFLAEKQIDYCKVPALQIKRSMGIIRGKNDKVDAQRIAEYAWLRKDILVTTAPLDQSIERLKHLLALRAKLVKDRAGYVCRLKEIRSTEDLKNSDPILVIQHKMVATISGHIKTVEQQIFEVINQQKELKSTFELLKSLKGVGPIVAAYMIAFTTNFSRFNNARQFNCYAGLAPFKYESGTSMKGRSRVSHLANKQAKTLLNLAACSAIRYDHELKTYYENRLSQGMRKMACVNIIRSKIVARMFAVVKRGTPYIEMKLAA
jgi:transposase